MESLQDRFQTPLKSHTPLDWAAAMLADPLGLLSDHAHLEKKAATNALDLLPRWPDKQPPPTWVQQMTAIAREEIDHLQVVHRLLERRGGRMSKGHQNPYAAALRGLIRPATDSSSGALMDRLMVSALIELRSCERFAVLGDYLETAPEDKQDGPLAKLYTNLWASEHGHFRSFLGLAQQLPGVTAETAQARWQWMLEEEAAILAQQPRYIGMHSGG